MEKETLHSIDFSSTIDEFASMKARLVESTCIQLVSVTRCDSDNMCITMCTINSNVRRILVQRSSVCLDMFYVV